MIKISAAKDRHHAAPGIPELTSRKKMKRILVPCDFSGPAQEAFKFAVKTAQRSKGEIHVQHIIDVTFLHGTPSLPNNYAFNLNFLKEMEEDADQKFRQMWLKHSPRTLPVKFIHRIGTLVPDVEAYVREHEMDLIVMGTHGAGGSKWGSNAEKIVRTAPVPVVVMRKCPEKDIRNIVLPLMPEHGHEGLMVKVKALQEFFHAKISLLWINTPGAFRADREAQIDLYRFAQRFGLVDYSLNLRSDYTAAEGILRFARETRADLIAIGTHARKGLSHWFSGSVAEEVVDHAIIPIWTCAINQKIAERASKAPRETSAAAA